jgi:hypothetical protein
MNSLTRSTLYRYLSVITITIFLRERGDFIDYTVQDNSTRTPTRTDHLLLLETDHLLQLEAEPFDFTGFIFHHFNILIHIFVTLLTVPSQQISSLLDQFVHLENHFSYIDEVYTKLSTFSLAEIVEQNTLPT